MITVSWFLCLALFQMNALFTYLLFVSLIFLYIDMSTSFRKIEGVNIRTSDLGKRNPPSKTGLRTKANELIGRSQLGATSKNASPHNISTERCIRSCGDTLTTGNYQVCETCVYDPPKDKEMCKFACMHTQSRQLRVVCDKCMWETELDDEFCVRACHNTANLQYKKLCSRCVAAPPITTYLCLNACKRIHFSWYKIICDKCIDNPPRSTELCYFACKSTASREFRMLCYGPGCR